MNRLLLSSAFVLGSTGLLLDSAAKSVLLVAIAAAVALLLKRDSAATRHVVWLVAIVAILAVPAFSAMLPQWRVLPSWAHMQLAKADITTKTHSEDTPIVTQPSQETQFPKSAFPADSSVPIDSELTNNHPAPSTELLPTAQSHSEDSAGSDVMDATSKVVAERSDSTTPPAVSYSLTVLPVICTFIWVIGLGMLALRLFAARWMLRKNERESTVIATSQSADTKFESTQPTERLVKEFRAAVRQIDVRQSVQLLVHPGRTIPIVWGIFRIRLVLPESASTWSSEQIRSVFLHELGHVKRGDTITQLLSQIAVALYWFNPIVWFAAYRLHVERERACDDLVLESGVKASAYAGHLLEASAPLPTSRLTQACALAMAGRSPLEDRLAAILSEKRNRRRVSTKSVVATLMMAIALVVPVAMLRAAQPITEVAEESMPENNNQTGDNDTGDDGESDDKNPASVAGALPAAAAPQNMPDDKDAKSVFTKWLKYARTDGKIPGALIGKLEKEVKYFIRLNSEDESGSELAKRFKKTLPRFDATRDWPQEDVIALLDDLAAIHSIPFNNLLQFTGENNILTGDALPKELTNVSWGKPDASGLRVAWYLQPDVDEHRLGSSLKSRILVHNSGDKTVFFIMPSWQQSGAHKAFDAGDKPIEVTSTYWTTRALKLVYRLPPGAYCETPAAGIGVGNKGEDGDWANVRPGCWILAKAGDNVRLQPADVEVRYSATVNGTRMIGGIQENKDPKDAAELWQRTVDERIGCELPFPKSQADREQLFRRVSIDLFGKPPSQDALTAFGSETTLATDIASLRKRIMVGQTIAPFTGALTPGEIRFKVLKADPDAANRPRVVTGPGYYTIRDKVRLDVGQTRQGDRVLNKATLRFFSADRKVSPPSPHEIKLPDGHLTYAIVWDHNSETIWVTEKGLVRKYDFSTPASVTEKRFPDGGLDNLPKQFHEALKSTFAKLGVPVQVKANTPKRGVKLADGMTKKLQWGEPSAGLRMALIRPPALGAPDENEIKDFQFVIQNVGNTPIRLCTTSASKLKRKLLIISRGQPASQTVVSDPAGSDTQLQPQEVTVIRALPKNMQGDSITQNKALTFFGDIEISSAPAGAWTGKLMSAEMKAPTAAYGLMPVHPAAKKLFIRWNAGTRWNGKIPGGLIGQLADAVIVFTDYNPTWKTTPALLKMLPRMDATRDWDGFEAIDLIDELAALQASPINAVLESTIERDIQFGKALPSELSNAPWGTPMPSGLRVAWLLEPLDGTEHRLGTPLKSRILFHNVGKKTIVFRAKNWHQSNKHQASDAAGEAINTTSTRWTTRGQLVPYRLRPGTYVEVVGAGIHVGAKSGSPNLKARVGMWIDAKPGVKVTFTPDLVSVNDYKLTPPTGEDLNWWKEFVAQRVALEKPLPSGNEVRRRLAYRLAIDLHGSQLDDEDVQAFIADRSPDALEMLAEKLTNRTSIVPATGALQSGPTTFVVLPSN